MDRYSYDAADKLLSVSGGILGSRTYTYTGAGEVHTLAMNGVTWTLDWDAAGHPYHTDYGDGAYSASAVNGLGQRVFSRPTWQDAARSVLSSTPAGSRHSVQQDCGTQSWTLVQSGFHQFQPTTAKPTTRIPTLRPVDCRRPAPCQCQLALHDPQRIATPASTTAPGQGNAYSAAAYRQ